MCGYISNISILEDSEEYQRMIEKKAENLYRTINQKMPCFPASNQAVKQKISITQNTDLTPQESEQLSQYASDDSYVQRQKADIQELTSLFRDMMGGDKENTTEFVDDLKSHFRPQPGFAATYKITFIKNDVRHLFAQRILESLRRLIQCSMLHQLTDTHGCCAGAGRRRHHHDRKNHRNKPFHTSCPPVIFFQKV